MGKLFIEPEYLKMLTDIFDNYCPNEVVSKEMRIREVIWIWLSKVLIRIT